MKRLQPFSPTKVVELPHGKGQTAEQIKESEAALQLAKVPAGATLVALDEKGQSLSSLAFAKELEKLQNEGVGEAVFLIGGAEGLHESVRQKARLTLSLSALTFPHMLVRPILAEQLYRAATILAGHPYHRE